MLFLVALIGDGFDLKILFGDFEVNLKLFSGRFALLIITELALQVLEEFARTDLHISDFYSFDPDAPIFQLSSQGAHDDLT